MKFLFKKGHKTSKETRKEIGDSHRGNKNWWWHGGISDDGHGYQRYTAGVNKGQFVHRQIMEDKIGRKLTHTEHVHHINGIKDDNRLENLIVLTKSVHHSIHTRKHFDCKIDGCKRPHRSDGMCAYHYNKNLLERKSYQ